MVLPTLQDVLGLAGPLLVRRIAKRSDWGDAGDPLDARIAHALQQAFLKKDTSPFSFWNVSSDEELRRVALALNSTTQSRTQKVELLAFQPQEFQDAGIDISPARQTLGKTLCPLANRLHFDLEATSPQLEQLCRRAMQAGREVQRCTEGTMREVFRLAQQEQCGAATGDSTSCQVIGCV